MNDDDLDPLPPIRLGRYRHYKGGEYEVVGVARHSETHDPLVVYRPLYNATGLWVRPYAMFFETVDIDGRERPRFAPIDDGPDRSRVDVVLEPMDEATYADWVETGVPAYADEKVRSGRWTRDNAIARSRQSLDELVPRGLATPDHRFLVARDAVTRERVGVLWYAMQSRGGARIAYVYDVSIDPPMQRRGYAIRVFEALETEARDQGLAGIGLHVFGHNVAARALYDRLGFRATDLDLFKPFGPA